MSPLPRIPKPVLSRRRKILMAIVVVGAAIGLLTLKLTAKQETAQIAQTAASIKETALDRQAAAGKALVKFHQGISGSGKQVALLNQVANNLLTKSDAKQITAKIYLLNEPNHINLYALSTDEVYVTMALFNRMQTEGQLAAAVAHALAHVIHGDYLQPTPETKGNSVYWVYPANAETKADILALKLMSQAGYDPNAMINMFGILVEAYNSGADVGFFTTHPNSEGRLEAIQAEIQRLYPSGVPAIMSK